MPEFLQERAQPGPIARAILPYFQDGVHREIVLKKLAGVRQSLEVSSGDNTEQAPEQTFASGGHKAASYLAARAILSVE